MRWVVIAHCTVTRVMVQDKVVSRHRTRFGARLAARRMNRHSAKRSAEPGLYWYRVEPHGQQW